MNKLVLSALAASVAIGTTNASEGDWAGLDAELNTLTSSLDHHEGGPNLSGYIEAAYLTGGDYDNNLSADDSDSDSEWLMGRMGLSVSGSVGGFGYHMDIDGSDNAAASVDANGAPVQNAGDNRDTYVTFEKFGIGWTMGEFRAPTTANHLENEEDMAFTNRSALGGFGTRETGLMASGSMDALGYWIHFGGDEGLTARVAYDVMSGDGLNLSLAYSMDDSDTADGADSNSWMEANVSMSGFSLAYTMGDSDANIGGADNGEDSATCAVLSYMVNADWTVSIRETDQDAVGGDSTMDWAINYNDDGGRWTIQSIENPGDGDDVVAFGVIVGF
jgi:hypothetical protein